MNPYEWTLVAFIGVGFLGTLEYFFNVPYEDNAAIRSQQWGVCGIIAGNLLIFATIVSVHLATQTFPAGWFPPVYLTAFTIQATLMAVAPLPPHTS